MRVLQLISAARLQLRAENKNCTFAHDLNINVSHLLVLLLSFINVAPIENIPKDVISLKSHISRCRTEGNGTLFHILLSDPARKTC